MLTRVKYPTLASICLTESHTALPYTTSAVGTGYWFLQLLDRVSPSQWAAIGVLGSLLFGLLTYLTEVVNKNWPPS
ncbi:phage holin [Shigella boydii]|uniref:phage holin n=1 Tax=Shigella boydii TaxID=621 RepID=UPI001070CA66|nr:phage holin [Shigella boydii]